MSTLKTLPNDGSVDDFLNSVPDESKRLDSFTLLELYTRLTGEQPMMWGTSIVGFGQYHYKSERSRQEGDWPLSAFSPRKQNLTLYLMPGFDNKRELLDKLGRHKTSKGCLYINRLADVDMDVLAQLVSQSHKETKQMYGASSAKAE